MGEHMPATMELPDTATHDEITEFVDTLIENEGKIGDDAGKTDSQRVADDPELKKETPEAEVKSGRQNDTAESDEDGDDDAGKKAAPCQKWLDDDLKAEVAAYGIDEKELADFTSREELERALRIFDRTAMEAGRRALAEKEAAEKKPEVEEATGRARGEAGRFLPTEGKVKEGRYEIGLDRDLFDENLIGELEKIRDHYDSRLEALESRFSADAAKAEEERFDGFIDALNLPKLFGKTGSESPEELKRRKDVLFASRAQQIGLEKLGCSVDIDESLVGRVARMVFADELTREDRKKFTSRIARQSNKRLGGSATRAHNDSEPLMEEMKRLYRELEGN